ncbi:MAG: hypothetical protein M1828_004139 [Chrysothrix sp. TS-e1954]|nr:MAG: hypothetical protein M1828_004139 [Chrysothrix sp. TS-e1954]
MQRPHIVSHHSSSLPSTPRPYARDLHLSRTPSPGRGAGSHSPRSVFSESNRAMATLRPTNPSCRYQSTQTSRRRIPYSIGADPLDKQKGGPPEKLDVEVGQKLSESIHGLYEKLLPATDNKQRREKVVKKLQTIFNSEWPNEDIQVSVFGSSGNTLCTGKSDVDVCITMRHLNFVCALAEVLARRGMQNVTCVHAKAVPIVKIWDPELEMACDLNVNNHIALKNTQMVKAYMELDDRLFPVILTTSTASGGTLSSYTWTLLVIHFLQTREKPVLPVLVPKDRFNNPRDDFSEELEKYKNFSKGNEETVGELLFGFFRRYAHEMDYDNAALSVRKGSVMTKKEKGWSLSSNNRLCVEEPFNTDRNLGNTADDTALRGIHLELRQAFNRIADGKDLDAEVCEQFEFPTEEPRSLFERPQAQPRPVLSRSASQQGRGGRHSGGGRGPKQRIDTRNGMNNRRSSSAAAFGGHASTHPLLQSPQMMINGQEYFGQLRPEIGDELARISQNLSHQEQQLRMRQAVMSQYPYAHAFTTSQGGPRQPEPAIYNQYRHMQNGYPSPRQSSMPNAPGSAPIGYPSYGSAVESPVSMSHSSSQQGASSTNPSSPLLSAQTPLRRTLQRSVVSSPGGTIRSHSQPARFATMPSMPPQYPMNGMPRYPEAPQQPQVNGHRPMYFGPYAGPSGPFYLYQPQPQMNTEQREYLGYGIGESPLLQPPGQQTPNLSSVPHFDDLRRQGRASSPRRREDSFSSAVSGPGRSPSPLPTHHEDVNGTYESPTREDRTNPLRIHTSNAAASQDSGPLIVNGASTPPATALPKINGTQSTPPNQAPENESQTPSSAHDSQSSLAESFESAPQTQPASSYEPPPNAKREKPWVDIASLQGERLPPAWISAPPAGSSTRARSPGAPSRLPNSMKQKPASSRPAIAPLDLAQPISAPTDLTPTPATTNGPLLSPVQETRTPSPTSSRKPHSRNTSRTTNGFSAPPVPTETRGETSERPNGHARTGSLGSRTTGPTAAAAASAKVENPWQQAGRKGKRAKDDATTDSTREKDRAGEKMPTDERLRKGG